MQHDDDVIHFTSSAAGAERLRVTRFTGRESISHCFRYEIDLVLDGTSPLEAIAVMKQDAALGIEHGESRNAKQTCWIHGTLAEFEARGQGEHTSTYRAVLVPRLWSLGMGRRTRVFVDKSVVQIITAVLDDAKIPGDGFEFRLKGAYTPREHTVQYQESDLAFITRLMEREGMFYFFVHDEKATKLVIADQQQAFPEFTKGASTIPYLPRATGGGESAEEWFRKEVVDAFTLHQRLVPGEVVLRDWNWRQPGQDLTAKAADTLVDSQARLQAVAAALGGLGELLDEVPLIGDVGDVVSDGLKALAGVADDVESVAGQIRGLGERLGDVGGDLGGMGTSLKGGGATLAGFSLGKGSGRSRSSGGKTRGASPGGKTAKKKPAAKRA